MNAPRMPQLHHAYLLGAYLRGIFMSGAHWQAPCPLSRRRIFIARLHHSGPPDTN